MTITIKQTVTKQALIFAISKLLETKEPVSKVAILRLVKSLYEQDGESLNSRVPSKEFARQSNYLYSKFF